MMTVNTRGTFVCSQACLPHLKRAENPHILNLSPPLNMDPRWFAPHVAYTMAKYGMSLCVLGMAREFAGDGIAVNALWPRTAIATAAIEFAGRQRGAAQVLPQTRDRRGCGARDPERNEPRPHGPVPDRRRGACRGRRHRLRSLPGRTRRSACARLLPRRPGAIYKARGEATGLRPRLRPREGNDGHHRGGGREPRRRSGDRHPASRGS